MVTCPSCGTELPADAMFCGECGRAVAGVSRRGRSSVPVVRPIAGGSGQDGGWAWGSTTEAASAPTVGLVCEQCGAPMSEDDIFCGECGHVSRAASEGFGSRDTVVIEPVTPVIVEAAEPEPAVGPSVEPEQSVEPEPAVEPEPPLSSNHDDEDVEETRIVDRSQPGIRFVLQFSTGESFTVFGSGLIGRSPRPEPGEYCDQLVRVLDPSRSVSKTHLEFGQENGTFWVLDRYSGNGTVLKEPDAEAVRCVPDRRYHLQRGTRVEVGEQFFIVS